MLLILTKKKRERERGDHNENVTDRGEVGIKLPAVTFGGSRGGGRSISSKCYGECVGPCAQGPALYRHETRKQNGKA